MENKPKYIIFLGAGASCSEGAPAQNQLFKRAFELGCHYKIDKSGHLKKYFRDFWAINIDDMESIQKEFPTFEEALGILELARTRQESFAGYYSSTNRIDEIINDLTYLMAEVLKETLKTKQCGNHYDLVQGLKRENLLQDCCFISLNYDILIDNAMIAVQGDYDLDYGIDFLNYDLKDGGWYKPDQSRSVKLLKLHGSLNWLYCSVCKKIRITPKKKSVPEIAYIEKSAHRKNNLCEICESKYVPILVPPTYFKNMSNYYLTTIWHLSENIIKTAKKVFFCGYSMPDSDIHIKYLLKRALNNGDANCGDIIIINNHKSKQKAQKEEEERRYKRLFDWSVCFTNYSFEEFAKNPKKLILETKKQESYFSGC